VEDAVAGHLEEVEQVRHVLDRRYDEIHSGQVQALDGEAFFEWLRQQEAELLQQGSRK
jgi:hypothetical protein